MSLKSILTTAFIALAAVALANQFDTTKNIINGSRSYF